MSLLSLNQFLILYNWFLLTALLSFLLLIARLYEKFSGVRTFFRWLLLSVLLFGVASVRYASIRQVAGDGFADMLYGIGGAILLVFCLNLYRRMISQNRSVSSDNDDTP